MVYQSLDQLKQVKGSNLEPSEWYEINQEMIDLFAQATGDFQWVHVDVERSEKESPFGGTIAHGFFTLSLLSKMLMNQVEIQSLKIGVNYGMNKLRFTYPVKSGSFVRLHSNPIEFEVIANGGVKVTFECKVEIRGLDKPALVGEFMVLYYE
jgi:acyl dehydratase